MAQHKESGFVLVEAVAAMAVAAIAAAALMAALSSSSGRSVEARTRMAALREAEMLLAECVDASDPAALETRGTVSGAHLSWTRKYEELSDYPNLQRVIVEVTWGTTSRKGATRLEAYRITPRP
jgi:type II secretory pathway pseudopilin PulG